MDQEFGACNLSLTALRAEPSDRSEMTSQLLFGDHFTILEHSGKWLRILTALDEYEGWIDHKQFTPISAALYVTLGGLRNVLGLAVCHEVKKSGISESLYLPAGSNIPQPVDNYFYLGESRYKLENVLLSRQIDRHNFSTGISDAAMFYLNAPYLWGGKSLFGIDCSGFTQVVFRQFGIKLRRDAWQQAEQGELVGFLQEAHAGDLAFFDNEEGRIIHVGIMLDEQRIIHASGRVRIDPIDSQGIYNDELNKYTHRLRIVRRVGQLTVN
jgi:hypothetical protein